MKRIFLSSTILLCACGGPKLTHVDKLGAATAAERGLYYFLPRADVLVQVEVTRTTKKPGEFMKDTCIVKSMLTADQESEIIKEMKVTYEMGDVIIQPVAGIDVDHIYRLELPRNFLSKNDVTFEFAPSGELKGGTIASENLTAKVVTQAAVSIAEVAGTFLGVKDGGGKAPDVKTCNDQNAVGEPLETYNALKRLLNDRSTLLSGMALSENVETTKWKIEKIDAQIEAILGRFVGTVEKKTITLSFLVDPKDLKDGQPVNLFELHKTKGVKRIQATDNVVWNDKFDRKENAEAGTPISLKWMVAPAVGSAYASATHGKGTMVEKTLLVYRIPKRGQAIVLHDKTPKAVKDLVIPQLGALGYLPNLKSAEFTLYEGTGGLMKLTASTKAMDPELIKAASAAYVGIDSTLRKPAELAPIDKLIQDLEKLARVKELEDKLNGTVTEEDE